MTTTRDAHTRSHYRYAPFAMGVFILLSWEMCVYVFGIAPFILPRPSHVIVIMFSSFAALLRHSYVTLGEAVGGMVIAATCGFLLAIALSLSDLVRRAVEPIIAAFQSFPKEAVAPVLIVWFGFGYESKVILAASISFFPIFVSCIQGIRSVPTDIINVMVAMRASRWELLKKAELPYALPSIVSGLRVAWTLSIIGAVISEFVGASQGLGYLILVANSQFDIALVFSALLFLAAMGLLGDAIIKNIGARLSPWYGVRTINAVLR